MSATIALGVTRDECRSRSSGRAPTSTKSGTPAPHCTRCSTRSRSNGSAQWSSITSTIGRAAATGEKPAHDEERLRATRRRRGVHRDPGRRGRARPRRRRKGRRDGPHGVGSRTVVEARNRRNTCASGANVAPRRRRNARRGSSHRPRAGVRAGDQADSSPGDPSKTAIAWPASRPPVAYRLRRELHSRPTNGVAVAPAGGSSDSRRYAATASAPFSVTLLSGASVTRARDQAASRLAEHQVAVAALPWRRRHVHRVADDVVAGAAHHHLAGVDRDTEPGHGEHRLHTDQSRETRPASRPRPARPGARRPPPPA